MSFSSEVKKELARIEPAKKCCMLAEISGFLRVAGSLRLAGGGRFTIVASTEDAAIARHYKKLIKEYFGSTAGLEVGESTTPGKSKTRGYRYYLTISPDEKSSQILRETGLLLIREGNDYFSDGIYPPIVSKKCDKKAYVRGIFLGCGTISDPKRSYQLEFVLQSRQIAMDLKKLLGSFVDLSANYIERNEDHVVYVKKGDYVSDMLGIMGADEALLEFENIRALKERKIAAQRLANCDSANLDKSLSASEEQQKWIRKIKDAGKWDYLPAQLQDVAELRMEHPDASLSDIGEMLSPPIKKPGVSKRFAKIKEIAENL